MTPPRAAGTRTSQSSTNIELGSIGSLPLNPFTPLCTLECSSRLGMSRPLLFFMAPVMSLTATTFPPFSLINWAAHDPTFPKPWRKTQYDIAWVYVKFIIILNPRTSLSSSLPSIYLMLHSSPIGYSSKQKSKKVLIVLLLTWLFTINSLQLTTDMWESLTK